MNKNAFKGGETLGNVASFPIWVALWIECDGGGRAKCWSVGLLLSQVPVFRLHVDGVQLGLKVSFRLRGWLNGGFRIKLHPFPHVICNDAFFIYHMISSACDDSFEGIWHEARGNLVLI